MSSTADLAYAALCLIVGLILGFRRGVRWAKQAYTRYPGIDSYHERTMPHGR